jgi:hypothetical protein
LRGASAAKVFNGDLEFWVRNVALCSAESHGADEALELWGLARKVLPHECHLGDHALPGLLLALARLDDLGELTRGNSEGEVQERFGFFRERMALKKVGCGYWPLGDFREAGRYVATEEVWRVWGVKKEGREDEI